MNWREFRPTIFFLVKFLGIYLVGNLLYGVYVTAYEPAPDPVTRWVTDQTAWALSCSGWDTHTVYHKARPTTSIIFQENAVVSVYEGCNGLNVMIIFVAFLVALGPYTKVFYWFLPVGLVIIHVANLFRIGLLFLVTLYLPDFLYFAHKYLFTAVIYAVVFVMWIVWVRMNSKKPV